MLSLYALRLKAVVDELRILRIKMYSFIILRVLQIDDQENKAGKGYAGRREALVASAYDGKVNPAAGSARGRLG